MPSNSTIIFLLLLGLPGRLRRAAAEEQELPRQRHALTVAHITDTHIGENCTALTFEACKPMRNLRDAVAKVNALHRLPHHPLQLPGGGGKGEGGGARQRWERHE